MLERIRSLKNKGFDHRFETAEIGEMVEALVQKNFLINVQNRQVPDTRIRLIGSGDELYEAGQRSGSCLIKPRRSRKTQVERFDRFIADPAALYFLLDSSSTSGYFRFYAAERVDEDGVVSEILFEDVLRNRFPSMQFDPLTKAVVLLALKEADMLDNAYLQLPRFHHNRYQGEVLSVEKLGNQRYIKKGIAPEFYKGVKIESLEFAHAASLFD